METSVIVGYFLYPVVLIVPCGMETSFGSVDVTLVSVLIVPCGMETARLSQVQPRPGMY